MHISTTSQKVFLAAYRNKEAEKVAHHLRRVYERSDQCHTLVQSPEAADLILVGGIGNEMSQLDYLKRTLHNPLIEQFPERCFTVSYRDHPVLFNRGVYESAPATTWNRGRCVTGSYELSGHSNAALGPPKAGSANSSFKEPGYKDLLFSFVGRDSHSVRRRLLQMRFQRNDVVVEDSSSFNYWDCSAQVRAERERHFANVLARSRFCLCPRGVGTGSIRLFEAMRSGVAPVILADDWIAPEGLPWSDFSIRVKENEVDRLEAIVAARVGDYARMGLLARSWWERHFAESAYFNYVVSCCSEMRERQRAPEALYWRMRFAYMAAFRVKNKLHFMLGRN